MTTQTDKFILQRKIAALVAAGAGNVNVTAPLSGNGTPASPLALALTLGARLSGTGAPASPLDLAASGVVAGTYGTAAKIPRIIYDAYGRATSVVEVDADAVPKSLIAAKGDLLVGTAAATAARRAVGADGTVLTADSTQTDGVKWGTATGGSSFWNLADKPTVADPRDEEFEGTAFSGWTQVGTPVATAIDSYAAITVAGQWRHSWNGLRKSRLRVQYATTGVSGNYILHRAQAFNTNDFIYARVGCSTKIPIAADDGDFGFTLTPTVTGAPDPNNRVGMFLSVPIAGNLQVQGDIIVAGVQTTIKLTVPGPAQTIEFIGLGKKGTAYHYYYCTADGSWWWLGTLSHASTMDRIGLIVAATTSVNPGNVIVDIDCLRFLANTAEPP